MTAGRGGARRGHDRVLLGLDHQPAAIARVAHEAGDRREVHTAVAGDGEHAATHRSVEAVVAGADAGESVEPNVLQVDMNDSVAKAVDEALVAKSRSDGVAGVEEEAQVWPGPVDYGSDLVDGLCDHHQVVVVGRHEAVVGAEAAGELGQPGGVAGDLVLGHQPAAGHGHVERRARCHHRHLAIDHDLRTHVRQQAGVRGDGGHFRVDAALGKLSRPPAGDEVEAVAREQRA